MMDALGAAGTARPGGGLVIGGLRGSSGAFVLASFFRRFGRPVLAVAPDERAAAGLEEDLMFFLGGEDVFLFPSLELLPLSLKAPHPAILSARMEVYHRLMCGPPSVIVTSARNLMWKLPPMPALEAGLIRLERDGEYPRDSLVSDLLMQGFTRVPMVEGPGEMSVRGAILDIFPSGRALPLRVEFFGDTVESIRTFNIATQRSVERLDRAVVLPAGEAVCTEEARAAARVRLMERAAALGLEPQAWEPLFRGLRESWPGGDAYGLFPLFHEGLDTLGGYLAPETAVFVHDREAVRREMEGFEEEVRAAEERLLSKGEFFLEPSALYATEDETTGWMREFPLIGIESLGGREDGALYIETGTNLDLAARIRGARSGRDLPLSPLAEAIEGWTGRGAVVCISAHNGAQAGRTSELLAGYGIEVRRTGGSVLLEPGASGVFVAGGTLGAGFSMEDPAVVVISEEEIFGPRVRKRPLPRRRPAEALTELTDLREGDLIVHTLHGIGLYRGIKRRVVEGVSRDFLLLEYLGGDRLYLPVERMDLLVRYHGFEGREPPPLDRLGGTRWKKTKGRIKKTIEEMAGELLRLYAARRVAPGFAFSPPDALFREFEAGFEYEETPDQARAIEECLADMTGSAPMDRLVCGDVGYGKTEVAMRAAFKAVLDGKQVAVLVPTTVLAQQHYMTFTRRFGAYPVNIDVLSRFRTTAEQRGVLGRLASGEVDIIIGTHRLAHGDISFRDLGLVIIDEEHRFGVRQKERLKRLRSTVDVLALTATPIPRTLHMSLASLRDLSIINTPPEDRLAVRTEVMRFDEGVVKDAIEREMDRGGQVFFVHNRVQSIAPLEDLLRRLVPGARVAVAHGQMREGELEKKMTGFVAGEYDVLLSTSIIESGLDIPCANTIIINRAETFGLAELYQLRGRVGRSSHRAYAYFMIGETAGLTPEASKRLDVIRELSEPGSGFKVAAYDLEIRGAGELLGTNQSGRIADVGFEMYTRILEETVREMKGEPVTDAAGPEVNLPVSAYIPEDYVPDQGQRLGLYKRFACVGDEEGLRALAAEVRDRYGPLPEVVENIVETASLRLLLRRAGARELTCRGREGSGRGRWLRINFNFNGAGQGGAGGEGGAGRAHGGGVGAGIEEAVIKNAVALVSGDPKAFRITGDGAFSARMHGHGGLMACARYVLKELLRGCYSEG